MVAIVELDPVVQVKAHSYPEAPLSSGILTRLRLETRHEHDAVEHLLGLMDTALTRTAYVQRLAQFFGFYGPLEAALKVRCARLVDGQGTTTLPLSTLLPRLNKAALLQQDLHCLGIKAHGLAQCVVLPPIETQAQVLGCLYVLEGASLGGRLITQHLQATLGLTPTTGGGFFEGYASNTARMWQGMRQLLVSYSVDAQTEDAIVANAIATFACLRCWCEQGNNRTNDDLQNGT